MDGLINSFQKLSITDNRTKHTLQDSPHLTHSTHNDILTNLMSNLKLSNNQDIDDLINQMDHLTINDEEIIVNFKHQPPFIFKYSYFHCGDVLCKSIPRYCESF